MGLNTPSPAPPPESVTRRCTPGVGAEAEEKNALSAASPLLRSTATSALLLTFNIEGLFLSDRKIDRRAAADACLVSDRAFMDIVTSFLGEFPPRIGPVPAALPEVRSMMTGSLLLCTRMLPAMLASVLRRAKAVLPDPVVPSCEIIDFRIPFRRAWVLVLEGKSAVLRCPAPPPRMSAPPTTTLPMAFASEGFPETDWRPATDCRTDTDCRPAMEARPFELTRGLAALFWEPFMEGARPPNMLREPPTEMREVLERFVSL